MRTDTMLSTERGPTIADLESNNALMTTYTTTVSAGFVDSEPETRKSAANRRSAWQRRHQKGRCTWSCTLIVILILLVIAISILLAHLYIQKEDGPCEPCNEKLTQLVEDLKTENQVLIDLIEAL